MYVIVYDAMLYSLSLHLLNYAVSILVISMWLFWNTKIWTTNIQRKVLCKKSCTCFNIFVNISKCLTSCFILYNSVNNYNRINLAYNLRGLRKSVNLIPIAFVSFPQFRISPRGMWGKYNRFGLQFRLPSHSHLVLIASKA